MARLELTTTFNTKGNTLKRIWNNKEVVVQLETSSGIKVISNCKLVIGFKLPRKLRKKHIINKMRKLNKRG